MELEDGLIVNSNLEVRKIEYVDELSISDEIKRKIKEIIPIISPAFKYGLLPIVNGESVYLSSPSGTQRSTLSIIGLLHLLDPSIHSIQGIVLCPRKDLVNEYLETFSKYNKNNLFTVVKCIGGEYLNKNKLKSSQIIVCTSGKLISFLEAGSLRLDHLQVIVFDVVNSLFYKELQPQSKKILDMLPANKIYWFLTPVFDEFSRTEFINKKPEGRVIEIKDNRVLKQVKFYFKYYESQEDIFQFLTQKCEDNDKKIVIFSCDSEELENTYTALHRFVPLKIDDSMNLDEQLQARDLFNTGNHLVVTVHGAYHLARKIICKTNVQVYCLDQVDSKMLLARARRGTFQVGDDIVLFCKETESEYISELALELGIDILSIS